MGASRNIISTVVQNIGHSSDYAANDSHKIPDRAPKRSRPGVEKSPFQILANRLEVDENVNKLIVHFKEHWLVVT